MEHFELEIKREGGALVFAIWVHFYLSTVLHYNCLADGKAQTYAFLIQILTHAVVYFAEGLKQLWLVLESYPSAWVTDLDQQATFTIVIARFDLYCSFMRKFKRVFDEID